jgi:hypothetical protein
MFRENIWRIGDWRFPPTVRKITSNWLLPWLDSHRPPQRSNTIAEFNGSDSVAANNTRNDTDAVNMAGDTSALSAELPVSEENISLIMAMGFTDRSAVERALRRNGNNVERAVNSLL